MVMEAFKECAMLIHLMRLMIQLQLILDMIVRVDGWRRMEDSSGDEREILPKVRKKSFVSRGPITMSELALVRNSGQKLPIQFNEHGQPIGATSKKIQSYIGVCVRQQIPIIYNSWKEVSNELKDKIYDCISKITHDVFYRSTLWKEARKGRNNDYFDDATQDCASRIDELVATHKNEDILIDVLGPKEHGGRVRSVGGFVSQSQYFNTVKGKEKMITPQVEICHKEEDDSRCKSDKKRSNHSRSSIGSINIDLDTDELLVNTPNNKGVEFNTKSAYRQEEIAEIRTKWASFVSRFVDGQSYSFWKGTLVCIEGEIVIRFKDDNHVSGLFEELWEENTRGECSTLQLYLGENVSLICNEVTSSSWSSKKKSAQAMSRLCEVLRESISSYHQVLLRSLMKEVSSLIWEEKETILDALGAISTACLKLVSTADPAMPNAIVNLVSSSCSKKAKKF
ncbi:proteasome-associated protein ECM29-like protein isoform X1 [Cucumis melo var. makuwa]|uniref:Proteasome-associated protein ECM29-like protein isoform X1 n=1 Tax=Cucumis melo var. makuwa TaxID=1194695 RepID=A0A5D3DIS5_CUCMM|nr:proteasome-associated protein ECM29-like protein isoform X1 [Cucumis melo var. makuwa]